MAKISALTDGDPAVATDHVVVARSGGNFKLLLSALKTLFNTNPTITGTVTATEVSGIERVVASWGVPVILGSSGTMGDNGAVSGMTALPTTYSGGCWMYFVANAIDGSNAAGFYWFVASSTTAGTVYNSTFDGESVPAAGTATAFVSTGPGAYNGVATGEILAATVAIGAGDIGPNGTLRADFKGTNNTAAGNKIFRVDFGGTDVVSATLTTNAGGEGFVRIVNAGVANRQIGYGFIMNGASAITNGAAQTYSSVDTNTAATSLTFTLEKATATNHAIWENGTVKIAYAP